MQYVYKLFCIGIAQFREIVWADIYDMFYKDVWAHKRKFMLFLFGQLFGHNCAHVSTDLLAWHVQIHDLIGSLK